MKIEKKLLQSQLELIKKCSSSSVNEDISDKIVFTNKGVFNNSRSRLITFLEGEYDFESMFRIDNLLNIVKAMPGEELDLKFVVDIEESVRFRISSDKTKLALKPEEISNIQEQKDMIFAYVEDKRFFKLPSNFLEGIGKVLRCASSDKNHTFLCNINVQGKDLIASDNFKIGFFQMEKSFQEENFLIDTYNIQPIIDFDPKSYCLWEDRIIFKRGQNYQICAINKDDYPDFKSIIERKSFFTVKFPDKIKEALYLAKQIPNKDVDRQISIVQENFKILVACKTQTGWLRQTMVAAESGNSGFRMNLNVMNELVNDLGLEIEINEEGTGKIVKDGFCFVFPVELGE